MTENKKDTWNKWADIKIKICSWNSCKDRFSQYVLDRACRELNLWEDAIDWWITKNWKVEVCKTWCMWKCKEWPNIKIEKNWKEQIISRVDPIKMGNIMNEFKKYKNKD